MSHRFAATRTNRKSKAWSTACRRQKQLNFQTLLFRST